MSVLVFDMGGTLMEYRGMPLSWADYYETGFRAAAAGLGYDASDEQINTAAAILRSYNPRINYREKEVPPESIFKDCLKTWKGPLSTSNVAAQFFRGLNLKAAIYEDSIPILRKLREAGHRIAALTDLPSAMPDELFQEGISELLEQIDSYVSSQSCGWRKPNPAGLFTIAQQFSCPVCELIFVGDEEKDQRTAQNAGCTFFQIRRAPGSTGNSLAAFSEWLRTR